MAAFYLQADVAQAMVPHLKGLVLFFFWDLPSLVMLRVSTLFFCRGCFRWQTLMNHCGNFPSSLDVFFGAFVYQDLGAS